MCTACFLNEIIFIYSDHFLPNLYKIKVSPKNINKATIPVKIKVFSYFCWYHQRTLALKLPIKPNNPKSKPNKIPSPMLFFDDFIFHCYFLNFSSKHPQQIQKLLFCAALKVNICFFLSADCRERNFPIVMPGINFNIII